jgi:trans-2,3-dihydro-3-hydroxyanthranilate isomerase
VKSASPNSAEIISVLNERISAQVLLFSTETENSDSDVHARMFGPEVGVVEDPATGSAAGPLAAYIEQYDLLNRASRGQQIIIEQGYEMKRPSRLIAQVIGVNDFKGVYVSGETRLVAAGIFFLEM